MSLWPFKRPALAQEQIVERGRRASLILESDDYRAASEEVVRDLFKRWTLAQTVSEREALHAEFRAWENMAQQFMRWKGDAARIDAAARKGDNR